ncbi:MAG: hypothetical protein OHK0046_50260 [Anaerolineae bacterium]
MRETALTCIGQQALVVLAVGGCTGEVVDVFAQVGKRVEAGEPLVNVAPLRLLRAFRGLDFFVARPQIGDKTGIGR